MTARVVAAVVVFLCACGGGQAGREISASGVAKLTRPCEAPGVVVAGAVGFECTRADVRGFEDRLRAIEQTAGRLGALEARTASLAAALAEVEPQVATLRDLLGALTPRAAALANVEPGPLAFSAAACVPAMTATPAYAVMSGAVTARPGPLLSFYCPVPAQVGADRWDTMEVLAVDPDGTSSRVSIETSLYALTPAGRETPGRINASSVASSSIAAPATFLDHRVSVADKYYLLGVELVSRSAGLAPAWYGARVYRRGAAAPAEIAPGGSLRIAFGAERDQRDAAGRVWHVGNRFLAPGHPPVARSYHPGTVDVAQLTDPVIPNGVLETAHWCGCDMHYQFAVLNARYRVVLYFSENCVECVGPPWGGTSNNSAHREFSVEVESQALAKFDIADAAWPPLGDGRGRTFTATQIAFDDVLVSDGVLDLRLLDLGPLNPPENPSINGISIEWIGP